MLLTNTDFAKFGQDFTNLPLIRKKGILLKDNEFSVIRMLAMLVISGISG